MKVVVVPEVENKGCCECLSCRANTTYQAKKIVTYDGVTYIYL